MNKPVEIITEIEHNRAIRRLEYIQNSICLSEAGLVCYALGTAFLSKHEFDKLSLHPYLNVIATKSHRTGWWRFLPMPVSSNFLISVHKCSAEKDLFEQLCQLASFAEVFYHFFDNKLEKEFVDEVKSLEMIRPKCIAKDRRHFIYGVDTDSIESTTGFMEFVFHGPDVPKELINLI